MGENHVLNLIFGILVWAVLGALPGYYVFLAKKRLPQYGLAVGAVLGVVMGELAVRLGVIGNAGAALLTLLAIWVGILLLLPHGEYDRRVTAQGRIAHIAYALTIPTILIVLGIVVFPLVWNLIFSVRDVRAADLGGIDIFDLSNLTMENFVEQVAFRVDPVSCEQDAAGSCVVDEDGNVVYEGARDVYDDYRGYREVNDFDLFGSHYAVGVQDRDFYPMIWRTIFYTLASTILAILFGLVAALLVLTCCGCTSRSKCDSDAPAKPGKKKSDHVV